MSLFGRLFSQKPTLSAEPDRRLHVDIHSHLLPGIDDGSPDIRSSVDMIKALNEQGITHVITTPHILSDLYPNTHELIQQTLEEVRIAVKSEGLNIRMDAAAEYYLDEWFIQYYLKGDRPILTLWDNYVLVETNYVERPGFLEEVVFEMQLRGYAVVFAHPERYHYLLRDFRKFEPLYESGMIFQSNLLSFAGYYGPEVQRAAKHLLKSGMIRMLGTDAHKMEHLVRIRDLKRSQEYAHLMEIPLLLPD